MSEATGAHQVLVLDNDKDFISLLKNELEVYGFEIRTVGPDTDKIHAMNLFKAEFIFIAVDAPEMFGYTLYDKARKTVGKFVPIVLTTATLSTEDFALHSRLKEPADAYLDKRLITNNKLPPEIRELIGMEPQTVSTPHNEDGSAAQREHIEKTPLVKDELSSSEELKEEEPMILDVAESKDNEKQALSSQTDTPSNQEIEQETKIMNKLKHTLSSLESEASHLFRQLEKENHELSPAQSLNDVLNHRDQNGQKDLEINHFVKKIQEDNKRVLAGKDKLTKFIKEMHDFEKEIDQDLKRNKEIAALLEIKQKMIDEAQKSAELLAKERTAHQETRKQLESKIAQLQAELLGKDEQHQFQLKAAEKDFKAKLLKIQDEHQQALKNLNENYTAQINQLRAEKNAEISALKERVSDEMQKITEMLTKKEKTYQESCQQYESKIVQLQEERDEAKKQQMAQLHATEEKHKTNLLHAEKIHSSIVDSIVKKFAAQLAQIRIDMDNERQSHQKVQKDLETKISQLSGQKVPTQEQTDSEQNVAQDEQKKSQDEQNVAGDEQKDSDSNPEKE